MRLTLLTLSIVAFLASASSARTWLIKPDGTGDWPTIQDAVSIAASYDTVMLDAGTFSGPGNCDVQISGKSFVLTSVYGPDSTRIYCPDTRGFAIANVLDDQLVIEGISIEARMAAPPPDQWTSGEGMTVNNSSLRIKDCIIANCGGDYTQWGAGMAISNSEVEVLGTVFWNNGGLYANGGHIFMSGGTLTIDSCEFVRGHTSYGEQGGGAIYATPLTSVRVTNSLFRRNSASINGSHGSAIFSGGSLVIRDCLFENNSGSWGTVSGSVDSLVGSTFLDNGIEVFGNGTVLLGDAEYISGNTFIQISHAADVGAMFQGTVELFENNLIVNQWDIPVLKGSAQQMRNNTFVLSSWVTEPTGFELLSDTTHFANNIFYSTSPNGTLFSGTGFAEVECSDIYVPQGSTGQFIDGGGNVFVDPLFCSYSPFSDYSLSTASPCIPENSSCGTLVGAKQAACAVCPTDTTLGLGARILFQFPLLNPRSEAETCAYLIRAEQGLHLIDDSNPGLPVSTITGNRILEANETAMVAVWVSVNTDATPGDSLRVSITQVLLEPLETDTCETVIIVSGAPVSAKRMPVQPTLRQNWPNPFNPTTTIAFTIPAGSRSASLTIYDVAGRVVRQLGSYLPGAHTTRWDGRDGSGESAASGIYLYRLEGTNFALTRKMVLLR